MSEKPTVGSTAFTPYRQRETLPENAREPRNSSTTDQMLRRLPKGDIKINPLWPSQKK